MSTISGLVLFLIQINNPPNKIRTTGTPSPAKITAITRLDTESFGGFPWPIDAVLQKQNRSNVKYMFNISIWHLVDKEQKELIPSC